MIWAWIVVAVVAVLTAFGIGYEKGLRAPTKEAVDQRPRCLCVHWYNEHKVGGGPCNVSDSASPRYDGHKCPCIGYLGPDPMASGMWHGDGLKPPVR